MLTGDELREARERARMTQQQVADRIGKTLRSVGNYERSAEVPRSAETLIRAEFPEWFGQPAAPLASVSDAQLLAEIARRFDRGREGRDGHGQQPAPIGGPGPDHDPDDVVRELRRMEDDARRQAAYRARSRGQEMKRASDELGEESQDPGDD